MGIVDLDIDYQPSEDEPFMNEMQQAYFRQKLETWKADILKESKSTIAVLQDESDKLPDAADRASSETDRSIELRAACRFHPAGLQSLTSILTISQVKTSRS